ncbi:MAG: hypothetical protein M1817_004368 [Caeruleum heppii]|nr:MAG: hypothetical protein M1817_004368 [Caeruleum heppii]
MTPAPIEESDTESEECACDCELPAPSPLSPPPPSTCPEELPRDQDYQDAQLLVHFHDAQKRHQLPRNEPDWHAGLQPRAFEGQYEYYTDESEGGPEYGRGAWSVVRPAKLKESVPRKASMCNSCFLSPPPTPEKQVTSRDNCVATKKCDVDLAKERIVAVKSPIKSLEDPKPLLLKEARILTYLQSCRPLEPALKANRYIVAFLGFRAPTFSLVYEALPLTLDAHCQQRMRAIKESFSTRTMMGPIVGANQWLHFAHQLISGLAFLHRHGVLHGDIKPKNILLRTMERSKKLGCGGSNREGDSTMSHFDPVYCDFSSARVTSPLSDDAHSKPNAAEEISAVTEAFTAPELLDAFYHSTPSQESPAIATATADVYALGTTLLLPATGEALYGNAKSGMQRLRMARAGTPLDFARQGEQASRIMRGNIVDRVVRCAVARQPRDRIDVRSWVRLVQAEMEG